MPAFVETERSRVLGIYQSITSYQHMVCCPASGHFQL